MWHAIRQLDRFLAFLLIADVFCCPHGTGSSGSAFGNTLDLTSIGTGNTNNLCYQFAVKSVDITYNPNTDPVAVGGAATLVCQSPYFASVDKPSQIDCLDESDWTKISTDPMDYCDKYCYALNGTATITYSTGATSSGLVANQATATASCTNYVGYVLFDGHNYYANPVSVICNQGVYRDSSFNHVFSYDCIQVCTVPPTLGANVNPNVMYQGFITIAKQTYVTAGVGSAMVTCRSGNYVWTDTKTMDARTFQCTGINTWATIPDCVPACLTPPPNLGTNVVATYPTAPVNNYVTVGQTATVNCAVAGYMTQIWSDGATAQKTLTCNNPGVWSTSLSCVDVCQKTSFLTTDPPGTSAGNPQYTLEIGTGFVRVGGTKNWACTATTTRFPGGATQASQTCTGAGTVGVVPPAAGCT